MTLSLSTKYLIMQQPSINVLRTTTLSTLLCFLLFFNFDAHSQNKAADLQLIATKQGHNHQEQQKIRKKVKFTQAVNPVYWVYKGGLAVYQKHISPQLSTHCIYETSCSRFSRKLIDEHGLVKGLFLTCDRLSKCNRITLAETSRLRLNKVGKIREEASSYSFKQ